MHNHFSALKYGCGRINDFGACLRIRSVAKPAAFAGIFFDQNLMTVLFHDLHPRRGHADAILFSLDFF